MLLLGRRRTKVQGRKPLLCRCSSMVIRLSSIALLLLITQIKGGLITSAHASVGESIAGHKVWLVEITTVDEDGLAHERFNLGHI